jgi:catechol 2,3-dioxygenase-like lactoylglutathione lyase family enzyme
MKRFHLHLSVDDLQHNIRFYSKLFGAEPAVVKPDYAKWMLEDPRVNFAISTRGSRPGLDHLGLQVDSAGELDAVRGNLAAADAGIEAESAECCYARSDKYWVQDPQGIAWEAYHTLGAIPVFSRGTPVTVKGDATGAACCSPGQAMKCG